MTLLELTVVILVLMILITVLFLSANAWKKGADRAACIMNIRTSQQATRAFENVNQMTQGDAFDLLTDLVGTDNYFNDAPECPALGSYTHATAIPPIGTLTTSCSLAVSSEHIPATYANW